MKLKGNTLTDKFLGFPHFTKITFEKIGAGVYSPSNRNEYQKQKNNNISGE
jgi:hypothetical protein